MTTLTTGPLSKMHQAQVHKPKHGPHRAGVLRWIDRLPDRQLVELVRRLIQVSHETVDIEPMRLRMVLREFAKQPPKVSG